jgi:porphobilinogen synthase
MSNSVDRFDLVERPRRLRRTAAIRRLVQENRLSAADLVLPVFVREGATEPIAIGSMPGVVQHSRDSLMRAATEAAEAGVGGIMLFGVPKERDACGDVAVAHDSILAEAVRWTKQATGDSLPVIADLCLDEFTSHGHCGVLDADGNVDNDATLAVYQQMGITLAEAGSDILGLSGMMDGQVGAVREALDDAGLIDTAILAYAAKYASAFYGPFRDAVESALQGDRKTYQQDPANALESLREVRLDIAEGADIVMVKPALPYLDILARTADSVDVPVAAYIVSGEYSMIEAAAAAGMIDRERAILEAHMSVKRAGASVICTYWATEVARLIK